MSFKSFYLPLLLVLSAVALVAFSIFREKPTVYFPRLGGPAVSPQKIESILKKSQNRIAKDPDDLESLVDQGISYFYMGPSHMAESLNSFNRAWQCGALDKRIFYYTGILYENLSLFNEAKKQYERFLHHEPKDREVRLRLARLFYRMENWEECFTSYQSLLKENPNDSTALLNCGLALVNKCEKGSHQKGITSAQKEELKENEREALSYLDKASQLDKGLPEEVTWAKIQLHYDLQEWQKAIDLSKDFHEASPHQKEYLEILAVSNEKLENWKEALQAYTQIAQRYPRELSASKKVRQLKRKIAHKKK